MVKVLLGTVLSTNGGAIKKMLSSLSKWERVAVTGRYEQYMNWVSVDDGA